MLRNVSTALRALLTRTVTIECDQIPHIFDQVPLRKLINWLLVEISVRVKPEMPGGWPTHLLLEPTNRCNLRCTLCPVTTGLQRQTGFMSFEMFRKLIDEIGEYLFLILLWDWGEPFLHPQIYDMISYARQQDIQVISSTNGHAFADPGLAEQLVRSGINSLIVSVDGFTQQSYERYRQGGNLDTVISGIRHLVNTKQRFASKTPLINMRCIAMKQNEQELYDLKALAEELCVDLFTVRTLHPYEHASMGVTTLDKHNLIPENPDYQRFKHEADGISVRRRVHNPCKNLWNNPAIHWDGTVCPCSFDPNEQYALGTLVTQSFKEIWESPSYRLLRRQFRKNYQELSLCHDCTYAFEGGSCGTEDIVETYIFRNHIES